MLLFQKKVDKVNRMEELTEKHKTREKPELEKGDLSAIIIASLLTFGPMLLIFIAVFTLLINIS